MKSMLLAAAGVLMLAPFAHAQQSTRLPDPADPGAAVPQPVYESALTAYSRTPQDSGVTPDKTWRQVNEAVAAAPGHAAHGAPPAPAPVHQQGPAAKPAPAPTHHQHH